MQSVTGPTIARWQLGEELASLREAAGLAWDEVGKHLGCSEAKIRRIEKGDVGMNKAELNDLLGLYKVDDPGQRERLQALQQVGKQRGWWSKFGGVSTPYAEFLRIESAATMIRTFEPRVIPGLLQTPAYTRALLAGLGVSIGTGRRITPEDIERQVEIRRARQQRVFDSGYGPGLWVVLDEVVLTRPGSAEVMQAQLEHLIAMADRCTIQVIPTDYGLHPGLAGPLTIYEFPEDKHSPIAYTEGHAGNLYMEKSAEMARGKLVFDHITAAALSPPDSYQLLRAKAQEWAAVRKGG